MVTFLLLLIGHAIADHPLQRGLKLSRLKNKYHNRSMLPWQFGMTVHASSHGLIVAWITGSGILGAAECIAHWLTDWAKCERKISVRTDQGIHVVCKIIWVVLLMV
jgi:hypothetical protein